MACLDVKLTRVGGELTAQFSLVCGTSVGDVLLLDSNLLTLADSEGRYLLATSNS